jgi:hypothetical protein
MKSFFSILKSKKEVFYGDLESTWMKGKIIRCSQSKLLNPKRDLNCFKESKYFMVIRIGGLISWSWENLKRDYTNSKLNCYETRLEEIINCWTETNKKYWKTQCTISPRRKRTVLFRSEIFKWRKGKWTAKKVRDEKNSPEICSGLDAERYRKEVNRYNKKKRRKKYKELWRNTISFNLYNGKFDIALNYIIQKRRKIYEEEILYNNYGYYYLKKDVEPILKGLDNVGQRRGILNAERKQSIITPT